MNREVEAFPMRARLYSTSAARLGYYVRHNRHTMQAMVEPHDGATAGRWRRAVVLAVLLGWTATVWAQAPPPPGPATELLPPVVVTAPPPVSSSSEQLIPGKDFEVRPQGRPADVLRLVPGLIIGQHQGGGRPSST